jgi:hypothetical protein
MSKPTQADCRRTQRAYRENPLAGGTGLMQHLATVFDNEDGRSVEAAYQEAIRRQDAARSPEGYVVGHHVTEDKYGNNVLRPRAGAITRYDHNGRPVIDVPLKSEVPVERRRRVHPVSIEALCAVDGDADLADETPAGDVEELNLTPKGPVAGEDEPEDETPRDATLTEVFAGEENDDDLDG